jgi:hypothetical protein
MNNYKALLHCVFIFVFLHGLFVIAVHQYQYFGINSVADLVLFPVNYLLSCLSGIYFYVWGHAAANGNKWLLALYYGALLSFAIFAIHFSMGEVKSKTKDNLASAFFGVLMAHIGVSATLAFVENAPPIYLSFMTIFNNFVIVLMSAIYMLFYIKKFQFIGLKNRIFCSVCGFFTGLFFQLFIGSGLFTHYFQNTYSVLKLLALNFMLICASLIIAIFITSFLQKSILNSYNKSLTF